MPLEHRTEEFACASCGKPVKTIWAYKGSECKGLINDPSYVLVADWIYCIPCWDKLVKENPSWL